ncbi:MAG: hypothetical protein IKJ80_07150 [Clostridia bacterium]|nr:hypothetical protein [Clostridia bacterium]
MKKALALLLSLALLLCSINIIVIAEDVSNPLQKLTFSYNSGEDYTATCYYTNDYFVGSSYEYNSSLATMSLSLAMSAFGNANGAQEDYSDKSSSARDLLMKMGVAEDDIGVNDWFTVKPTMDSIGVIIGNMPITISTGEYTLIAVAVRGGGYEKEWASNFTIGAEGQHQGFAEARDMVAEYLKTYVDEQDITGEVKLWITGYSRAAATANLLAGSIDDGMVISEDISYDLDDVYTYCFETPAGALTSEAAGKPVYNNIFSVINPNDLVPFVAPAEMGFCRYGIDVYLPSAENSQNYEEQKAKMLEVYDALPSTTEYIVDNFQMKKLNILGFIGNNYIVDDTKNDYSQSYYLSTYVGILATEFIKDRNQFVTGYQTEIREICSVVFGGTEEQTMIIIDSFSAQAQANWGALVGKYVLNGINPWADKEDAFLMVSEWLKNALDEAGITDYDEAVIDSAGKALATLMLDLVVSHPNYFSTAVMNLECIASAHFPELCYSWLVSMDANYTAEPEITEPETTEPEVIVPETTMPETTAPETTVPETTVPETTVPETTVPETTVPETTVPETTVPETTVPETTAPETTVPETTVPETTAPETTVPETTAPETTVPETTVPETTVPETTVPETTVPETTVPEVTEPVEPEIDHFDFAQNADTSNVKLNESAGTITFSSGSVSSDEIYSLLANDDVVIKDAKGNVVTDGKVGTGYTVTSTVNGTSETVDVVVVGDINGDGNVASADVLTLTSALISGKQLNGAYKAAADSNGDGAVTSTDILHLSSKVRGW